MNVRIAKFMVVSVMLVLCSCEPKVNQRGNMAIFDKYSSFVVGKTKTEDVLKACGSPSLCVGSSTWIYVCYKSEEISFRDVETKDRMTVRMEFDDTGLLKSIEKVKENRLSNIQLDENVTRLTTDKETAYALKKYQSKND
ncbi:hypothetical protein FACS189449_02900 [Alphaproteobacteria bacterium]|nr:hypothetical protein FACS189449_02900 [Alphaproteobacteria bacterium]